HTRWPRDWSSDVCSSDLNITWWKSGHVTIRAGTHIDGLSVMMVFVVTFISLLVHVYSTSYMHGDRRYTHFFAILSLFTAAMLLLVLSSETLELLVGWEGVGLCSFLLIGHWWEEQENSDAALKAFLTTRTGDIGMLVGISILFFAAGQTFNIAHLNALALNGSIRHGLLLAGAACVFAGVVGKSAQFPLHTWLPDAMAGPTPVSALIHAATMVAAGVYVVARLFPLFGPAHATRDVLAVSAAITMLLGALAACAPQDITRVLASST